MLRNTSRMLVFTGQAAGASAARQLPLVTIPKRFATVSAKPAAGKKDATKPVAAPRTFQLKSNNTDNKATASKDTLSADKDKPSAAAKASSIATSTAKPSTIPLPTIPFDTPSSILEDLTTIGDSITAKTTPSTPIKSPSASPRGSPTKPASPSRSPLGAGGGDNSKEIIRDLRAQLAQVSKERNTLKQSLTAVQQEQDALIQERTAWQSQTAQLSALEAIYGDAGLGQLKNLVKELTPEESATLRVAGFDIDVIDGLLEQRLKDLVVQFTIHTSNDIAKLVNNQLKRLRDLHKQSSSAATATQQTLKNANLPEAVIVGSVASLQLHLDEIQAKLGRWEKVKADVDLLLATHQ